MKNSSIRNAAHVRTATTANNRFSKKAMAVSAALVLALSGGAAYAASIAMASEATVGSAALQQVVYTWAPATSGDTAAAQVGLARFGLPASVDLGDLHYENPAFAFAGRVAQATFETPATELVIRKAVTGKHEAPMSDRKDTEFVQKWERDVDDAHLTLLGATQDRATVITWKDGVVEYGITWQGLGGDEMAMDMGQVDSLVRAIREANAVPQQQNQQQAAPQQQTQQQVAPQQQAPTDNGIISSDKAISIATSYVAGDNNVSNVGCVLTHGQTTTFYTVTFHFDDADYTVKVVAADGSILDATATYNDGTTRSVTQSADEANAAANNGLISSDQAIGIATSYVAGDNNVSNVGCDLTQGQTTTFYTVTFHFDDADYAVRVAAADGTVLSASQTYNDGTTYGADTEGQENDEAYVEYYDAYDAE